MRATAPRPVAATPCSRRLSRHWSRPSMSQSSQIAAATNAVRAEAGTSLFVGKEELVNLAFFDPFSCFHFAFVKSVSYHFLRLFAFWMQLILSKLIRNLSNFVACVDIHGSVLSDAKMRYLRLNRCSTCLHIHAGLIGPNRRLFITFVCFPFLHLLEVRNRQYIRDAQAGHKVVLSSHF
jgi:hypothetical protein